LYKGGSGTAANGRAGLQNSLIGGKNMNNTEQLSTQHIEEALELLSLAAKEKKEELLSLASQKYSDLQQALMNGKVSLSEAFSETKRRATQSVREATHKGQEKITDMATRLDENVHASPWPFIGGVAVGALILGLLLGRRD
jgi:ElaB/YqjD/DUF883 family membrane-anchored ribosome-binding protein